jgi:hypothetical protein
MAEPLPILSGDNKKSPFNLPSAERDQVAINARRIGVVHRHHEEDTVVYDVIIAGAGPVGLFLACELRLAKLSVLALEQLEDPRSPLKRLPFGMRGLRRSGDLGSGAIGRNAQFRPMTPA